jgi:hypothetical protein
MVSSKALHMRTSSILLFLVAYGHARRVLVPDESGKPNEIVPTAGAEPAGEVDTTDADMVSGIPVFGLLRAAKEAFNGEKEKERGDMISEKDEAECKSCLNEFSANGGCEAITAGEDVAALIPAGCDGCGGQARKLCGVEDEVKEVKDKNEYHVWIGQVNNGVTKKAIEKACGIVAAFWKDGPKCLFHGDPEKGVDLFTLKATEGHLAPIISEQFHDILMYMERSQETHLVRSEHTTDNGLLGPDVESFDTTFWGLDRIDNRNGQTGRYDMPSHGGEGVDVYVHDTGINVENSAFEGRAIPTLDMTNGYARECRGTSSYCANDVHGHGTHCAGTIAGKDTGVAKKATVHAVKVLRNNGKGQTDWGTTAMLWMIESNVPKPAVVSASLGSAGKSYASSRAIQKLVNYGIPVVVAAGNGNINACDTSPASLLMRLQLARPT